MTPRTKSALLTFLVAVQGYQLVVEPFPATIPVVVAAAVVVAALTAGTAYLTEHRLRAKGRT